MHRSRTTALLKAALVAALIGASALIAIPIGPVPVTLQVLVIAVAALVLTPAEAFLAVGLYLVIGTFGVPVFSGGGAGPGVLLGPTGGFLLGFLVGAPLAATLRRVLARRVYPLAADLIAVLALLALTYGLGLAGFSLVSGRTIAEAFALAVAPFVLLDSGKAAAAIAIARALRAAGLADGADQVAA